MKEFKIKNTLIFTTVENIYLIINLIKFIILYIIN